MNDLHRRFLQLSSPFPDRISHLIDCADQAGTHGAFLELGVWKGDSVNALARAFPARIIDGFDSFQGLPETWIRSFDGKRLSAKGEFALTELPAVEENVRLHVGFFEASLPRWLATEDGPVSFLHLDCDLYSSTSIALDLLNPRIRPGTVIVFDELCDWNEQGAYQRWRDHEWRALGEWVGRHRRSVEPLSRTNWIEGALQVLK